MGKIGFDSKYGLYYREDKNDRFIMKEQRSYKEFFENCKDMVVLDMGANIGAFSNNALSAGAKKVFAFEPDPDNVRMIKKQPFYNDKNFYLIPKAISDKSGTATFYTNSKKNAACHSLLSRRGRDKIEVKTVALDRVINKAKPDAIKMDIEGAEYLVNFDDVISSDIKLIAIELHFDYSEKTIKNSLKKAQELKRLLLKNFKELTKPYQSRVAEDKFWKLALFIGVRG